MDLCKPMKCECRANGWSDRDVEVSEIALPDEGNEMSSKTMGAVCENVEESHPKGPPLRK